MKLNNEVLIPEVGIGTFMLSPSDAYNSVKSAINDGYRLIDTANAYVNEKAVGKAIKDSGIDRKEIFLSTKIWPSEYLNDDAVDQTLKRLGVDYVDLLFLHQPCKNYMHAYKNLEKAYKEGKIRSIGVSNFEGEYIEDLLKNCEILPQVIQVEAHPYFPQTELRKITDKYDIKIMSWYPLGHGDKSLINEKVFLELAKKYGKTPAQICLRWHVEKGFIVIPGSKNPDHIKDNFEITKFTLSDEDVKKIDALDKNKRYYIRTEAALEGFSSWQPEYEK